MRDTARSLARPRRPAPLSPLSPLSAHALSLIVSLRRSRVAVSAVLPWLALPARAYASTLCSRRPPPHGPAAPPLVFVSARVLSFKEVGAERVKRQGWEDMMKSFKHEREAFCHADQGNNDSLTKNDSHTDTQAEDEMDGYGS